MNDSHDVVSAWATMWQAKYGKNPFVGSKEYGLAKQLLQQMNKAELLKAIERFGADDGAFASKSKHSFSTFFYNINTYLVDAEEGTGRI